MSHDNSSWNSHHSKKQKIKQLLFKVNPFTITNFSPPTTTNSYNYLWTEKAKKKILLSEPHKITNKISITNNNSIKLSTNKNKKNYLPFLDDTISIFRKQKNTPDKRNRISYKSQNKNDKNKLNQKIITESCYFRDMVPIAEKLKEYLLLPFNEQKNKNIVNGVASNNFKKNSVINLQNFNCETMKKLQLRNDENYFKNNYPTFNENLKNYCNQKFKSEKKMYRVTDNKIVSENIIYHNYTLINFKQKTNSDRFENAIYKTIKLKKINDRNNFSTKGEEIQENLNDNGELIDDCQFDQIKPTRFLIDSSNIINQGKIE